MSEQPTEGSEQASHPAGLSPSPGVVQLLEVEPTKQERYSHALHLLHLLKEAI